VATRRQLNDQPPHSSVDWSTLRMGLGGKVVSVTCPVCGEVTLRPAKEVRSRIKRGIMTGLCRRDGKRQVKKLREEPLPEHALIDWQSLAPSLTGPRVRVVCPVCGEGRMVDAKNVRRQLRQQVFTGRCPQDRLVGRSRAGNPPLPSHAGVEWTNLQIVVEGDGRRRAMIRVTCPVCGELTLYDRRRLVALIAKGRFRVACAGHTT